MSPSKAAAAAAPAAPAAGSGSGDRQTYPLEKLQTKPFPEGVKSTEREMYLDDIQFQALFKMTKEEWAKVPKWKRNNAKKKHKLF